MGGLKWLADEIKLAKEEFKAFQLADLGYATSAIARMVQKIKRAAVRQISRWQGSWLSRLSAPNTINDARDTRKNEGRATHDSSGRKTLL
jgi:hypothetical protein